jgi:hypothetical protein
VAEREHDGVESQVRARSPETSPTEEVEPVEAVAFSLDRPLAPSAATQLQRLAGNQAVNHVLALQRELAGQDGADSSSVRDVVSSGGSPLSPAARQRMESSFGTDFSTVRVHSGGEAAASAASVGASAYTVGEDIVVGGGGRLDGPSGERMLAHELTHVVQQRSGPVAGTPTAGGVQVSDPGDRFEREATHVAEHVSSGGSVLTRSDPPVTDGGAGGRAAVQRLSVENTDWDAATGAKHSASGAVGVLIVRGGGGPPVVVKAGELLLPETSVASMLLSAGAGGSSGGWRASAPKARPVGNTEAGKIASALEGKIEARSDAKETKFFMEDVAANKGVMVYGFVTGEEMSDVVANQKQTKRTLFGRKLRPDSLMDQMMSNPGLLNMLGRAAATDIVMANSDRFTGKVNLQNVMVDLPSKYLYLIDNIEANSSVLMRDFDAASGDTGERAFRTWASEPRPKALQSGAFAATTKHTMDELRKVLTGGQDATVPLLRKADQATIRKTFDKRRVQLEAWFSAGLTAGREAVVRALRRPGSLTGSISGAERDQVNVNLRARGLFVSGYDADSAWMVAEALESSAFGGKMPPLPSVPSLSSSASSSDDR